MKSQQKVVVAPQTMIRVLVAGKTGAAAFKQSASSPIKSEWAVGCGCNFSF